jgi:hypothetical protein
MRLSHTAFAAIIANVRRVFLEGFVTLAGFTCFFCLAGESRLSDSNALASPRHDRKRLLLAQCDNAAVRSPAPAATAGAAGRRAGQRVRIHRRRRHAPFVGIGMVEARKGVRIIGCRFRRRVHIRREGESLLRREADVPGDLLRAQFGNVTEPRSMVYVRCVQQCASDWQGVAD